MLHTPGRSELIHGIGDWWAGSLGCSLGFQWIHPPPTTYTATDHHRPTLEHSSAPTPAHGGRPEPYIEEPLFDLDPDFDTSGTHLMKMFNMLVR